MPEIRTKTVKVRVTENELAALKERSGRRKLAQWLRELGLGQRKCRTAPVADPALLRALSAHGGLLNQIARRVNTEARLNGIDKVRLLTQLCFMERHLKEIRDVYDETG